MSDYIEYIDKRSELSTVPNASDRTLYIFAGARHLDNEALQVPFMAEDMVPPDAVLSRLSFQGRTADISSGQFFLGARHSGAPPHAHAHAFNYVMHGHKKWWLFPPVLKTESTLPWEESGQRTLSQERANGPDSGHRQQPLQCVQEAGDALYVPAGWTHATVNIETTIGVVYEFDFPSGYLSPRTYLSKPRTASDM